MDRREAMAIGYQLSLLEGLSQVKIIVVVGLCGRGRKIEKAQLLLHLPNKDYIEC
jgi:hypothetical protein